MILIYFSVYHTNVPGYHNHLCNPVTLPVSQGAAITVGNACSVTQFMRLMFHKASQVIWEILCQLPILQGKSITVGGSTIPFTQTMEVNPSVGKFWKSLREISTEVVADAVITLPEGTFILGVQNLFCYIHSSLLSINVEILF